MRVRAAEAEGADRNPARRPVPCGEGERLAVHPERTLREIDGRVAASEMQHRRHHGVLEAPHRLDEARNAGGRRGVTDVRFGRAEQLSARLPAPVHTGKGRVLDGVAERRAGAVRLNDGDAVRIDAEALVDLAHQALLRQGARGGDAVGGAVLIGAAAQNDAVHRIAVGQRLRQGLEQDGGHGLSRHDAVRARPERGTAPARRQHVGLVGIEEEARRTLDEDAAGERHVALALAQAAAGHVDGNQRAGTGGIHRNRRPLQVQPVGQPRRDQRCRVAPERLARRLLAEQLLIVAMGAADEDAAARADDIGARMAGMFQRLPGLLQEQPLLRVHPGRLKAGNTKKHRIEAVDVLDEAAMPAIAALRHIPVMRGKVEAGHRADEVVARHQVLPELLDGLRSGEASADTDDGDGLGRAFPRPCQNRGRSRCRSGERRGGRGIRAVQRGQRRVGMLAPQEGFQLADAGEIEQARLVERDAKRLAQAMGEFRAEDRVETVIREAARHVDALGRDIQRCRDKPAQQAAQILTDVACRLLRAGYRHRFGERPFCRHCNLRSRACGPRGKQLLSQSPFGLAGAGDPVEAGLPQGLRPAFGRQRRRAGNPALAVGEAPPPVQQAEGHVGEHRRSARLVDQQHAVRRHGLAHGLERAHDIGRRMQDIGGNDEIVASRLDSLPGERLFDIQQRRPQARHPARIAALGMDQEGTRHIGVAILGDATGERRERRENRLAGPARPRTDLQDAQGVLRPACADMFRSSLCEGLTEPRGNRVLLVDRLDQLQRALREQHVRRLSCTRQDVRQRRQRGFRKAHLRCQATRLAAGVPAGPGVVLG